MRIPLSLRILLTSKQIDQLRRRPNVEESSVVTIIPVFSASQRRMYWMLTTFAVLQMALVGLIFKGNYRSELVSEFELLAMASAFYFYPIWIVANYADHMYLAKYRFPFKPLKLIASFTDDKIIIYPAKGKITNLYIPEYGSFWVRRKCRSWLQEVQ